MSRYQKGKTNLDFTEARDSELQWHQLGHVQLCTSLQTDNHTSTSPLSFLQAGCPSCCPTNSVKALKAHTIRDSTVQKEKKYLTVCQCSVTEIIHNRLMHSANTHTHPYINAQYLAEVHYNKKRHHQYQRTHKTAAG